MMKKLFLVLSVIGLVSLGFVSCGDDDDENPSNGKEQKNGEDQKGDTVANGSVKYVGTMNVAISDSSSFSNPASECVVVCDSTLSLILLNAKFAERMPSFDSIRVDGISYSTNESVLSFSGESLVPSLMGKPFAQYTISGLNGSVKGDSLVFSGVMGNFPIQYAGVAE